MDVIVFPKGPLGSNMYAVTSDSGYILIDPSVPMSEPSVSRKLGEGFKDKISAILLTHAHFDHCECLDEWVRATGSKAYLNDSDKILLSDPNLNCSLHMGDRIVIDSETIDPGSSLSVDGVDFTVIMTPGHTPGSVCYLIAKDSVMFTGDTLFAGSIGRSDLPLGDPSELFKSLGVLSGLSDDIMIYPGHGFYSKMGLEKKHNPFL